MGCASGKPVRINSSDKPLPQSEYSLNAHEDDKQAEDEDDIYVTLEEAIAFVGQELNMCEKRAKQLVLTVDSNCDGKISSVELVLLNERIKEVKNTLEYKFQAFDVEGKGFVSPDEAIQILAGEFEGLPIESLKAMIFRFDTDSNNVIDFTEFVEFYACVKAKKQNLENKFNDLDQDGSGDLDAEELVEVLITECALKEFQARTLVDDFDINHDGTLDKEEFMTMWCKLFG